MKNNNYVFLLLLTFFSCSNANEYYNEAKECHIKNNDKQALILLNKAINLDPNSVNYLSFRAMLYDLSGLFTEEISDLNKIVELNDKLNIKSINIHFIRSTAKLKMGLYEDALSDINYFINNNDTISNLAEAYISKASILYKLGRIDSAKVFYSMARIQNIMKENSIESNALIGLANMEKNNTRAMELIDSAIINDPSNYLAYGKRATLNLLNGNIQLAKNDFAKSISLNPNDAAVLFNLAKMQLEYTQEYDAAIKNFNAILKLSPQEKENGKVYLNLAVCKNRLAHNLEALADIKRAEEIDPHQQLVYFNYAMILSDLDRNQEALEQINKAIAITPTDVEALNLKGSILLSLSLFDDAITSFKKAVEANPKCSIAFYNLGYSYGEMNNPELSVKYYHKAVILNYDLESTLVNRALEKIKINQISSACSDIQRAIALGRTEVIPLLNQYCK